MRPARSTRVPDSYGFSQETRPEPHGLNTPVRPQRLAFSPNSSPGLPTSAKPPGIYTPVRPHRQAFTTPPGLSQDTDYSDSEDSPGPEIVSGRTIEGQVDHHLI